MLLFFVIFRTMYVYDDCMWTQNSQSGFCMGNVANCHGKGVVGGSRTGEEKKRISFGPTLL